jgi:outer membrane protein assembly factor BamB
MGVFVAGAFACAGQSSAVPIVPIASSSPAGLTLVWQNHELHPIGQPIAVGTVAIGIVSRDRHAFVVAIDPVTGRSLWQQQLAVSWITPGEEIRVTPLGDDKVAYLRPISSEAEDAKLIVADVHTGKDLAASPPELFTSPPIVCANRKDVCAIIYRGPSRQDRQLQGSTYLVPRGSKPSPGTQLQFRLDIATGDALAEIKLGEGTRFLDTTGLIDLGDRPGNSLGLLRGGAPQWLIPGSAAFPPNFSSDHGWQWHLFSDPQVFVGTLHGEPTEVDGNRALDLSTGSAMAGLSERTGKVLWRDLGSDYHCSLGGHAIPIRCRASGLLVFGDDRNTVRNFHVTVEGFDVTTGRTTWSVPMGDAKGLQPFERPAIAGPSQVLLDGPAGPVVLDYMTGHVEPPAPGATFWCMTLVRFDLSPPFQLSRSSWFGARHGWEYERHGGQHAFVCDGGGTPASALPSIAATMAAGVRIGDQAIIATTDGYLGFRAPPP